MRLIPWLALRLTTHRCYCSPTCERRISNKDPEHFAMHPDCVARNTEEGRWAAFAMKGTR